MSYDLTIWKQSPAAKDVPADEILAAIAEDEAHPAMQRFDAQTFIQDLQEEFGGEKLWANENSDWPFLFDVCDFTGTPANWISVNISFSKVNAVLPKLVEVATRHGLMVFDFQTEEPHEDR